MNNVRDTITMYQNNCAVVHRFQSLNCYFDCINKLKQPNLFEAFCALDTLITLPVHS